MSKYSICHKPLLGALRGQVATSGSTLRNIFCGLILWLVEKNICTTCRHLALSDDKSINNHISQNFNHKMIFLNVAKFGWKRRIVTEEKIFFFSTTFNHLAPRCLKCCKYIFNKSLHEATSNPKKFGANWRFLWQINYFHTCWLFLKFN